MGTSINQAGRSARPLLRALALALAGFLLVLSASLVRAVSPGAAGIAGGCDALLGEAECAAATEQGFRCRWTGPSLVLDPGLGPRRRGACFQDIGTPHDADAGERAAREGGQRGRRAPPASAAAARSPVPPTSPRDPADEPGTPVGRLPLSDILRSTPEAAVFLSWLVHEGLLEVATSPPSTLFAPTNAAMQVLAEALAREGALALDFKRTSLLLHHVVRGFVPEAALVDGSQLETLVRRRAGPVGPGTVSPPLAAPSDPASLPLPAICRAAAACPSPGPPPRATVQAPRPLPSPSAAPR